MTRKKNPRNEKDTAKAESLSIDVTPLELATLAVQLKQAGLIQSGDRPLVEAQNFLEASREAIETRRSRLAQEEALKKEEATIKRITEGLKDEETVPVAKVLNVANVKDNKLNPKELQSINIKEGWEKLSKSEQQNALFRYLTRKPVETTEVIPLLRSGKTVSSKRTRNLSQHSDRMIKEGVPVNLVPLAIELLKAAHNERRSDKAKQPKPRNKSAIQPRSEGGQFNESKPKGWDADNLSGGASRKITKK